MFVMQAPLKAIRLGRQDCIPEIAELPASKFDLTLFYRTGQDSGQFAIEYRTARFTESEIRRLLDRWMGFSGEAHCGTGHTHS